MKYRALAAFSAGALFATVIVGATQLVGASNDNVITVCANKRTGAMRYLTKGSCKKKTENQVSWSSIGPTGATGQAGPTGLAGAKGDKGEIGLRGEPGPKALLVDSTGKELGPFYPTNSVEISAFVDADGGVWDVSQTVYRIANGFSIHEYRDAACNEPLLRSQEFDVLPSPSTRWVQFGPPNSGTANTPIAAHRATNSPSFKGSTLPAVYIWRAEGCINDKNRAGNTQGDYSSMYFWNPDSVAFPSYTPPLRVVRLP